MQRTLALFSAFVLFFCCSAQSQQTSAPAVPRLIRFSGTVASETTPRGGTTVGVTFALYKDQTGGAPLWQEVQNVAVDGTGHYSVLLGASSKDGIPAELFTGNEARWLGVQVEREAEQPRILLVSVPYALKASDAETLGGRPASAFVLNQSDATTTAKSSGSASSGSASSVITPLVVTTPNVLPKFADLAGTLTNSQISDDGKDVWLSTAGSKLFFKTPAGSLPYFSGNLDNQLDVLGATGGTRWLNNAGSVVNMVLLDNGNVGIGTGAPAAKLDVVGNTNVYGNLRFTASNGQLQFNTPLGTAPYFSGNLDSQLDVRGAINGTRWLNNAGSLVNMSLLDSGNVGIGIGAPAARLDVNGGVLVRSVGITFPDASLQTKAASVTAAVGSGIVASGTGGASTLDVDKSILQKRISSNCPTGAISQVNQDGTATCTSIVGSGGTGPMYFAPTGGQDTGLDDPSLGGLIVSRLAIDVPIVLTKISVSAGDPGGGTCAPALARVTNDSTYEDIAIKNGLSTFDTTDHAVIFPAGSIVKIVVAYPAFCGQNNNFYQSPTGYAPSSLSGSVRYRVATVSDTTSCPSNLTQSGNSCVDTTSDPDNCGAPANVCPRSAGLFPTCNGGACGLGGCREDYQTCPGLGVCGVNVKADPNNCGSCGYVCPKSIANGSPAGCSGNSCQFACNTGYSACGYPVGCYNLNSDNNNCGSCGNICPSSIQNGTPTGCSSGTCGITCNSGYTKCTSSYGYLSCVNTSGMQTDPNNCGGCGIHCASGVCSAGKCQ